MFIVMFVSFPHLHHFYLRASPFFNLCTSFNLYFAVVFFFSLHPLLFANITPLFVLDLFVVTVCSPYSTSHTSSNYLLHPRLLTPPLIYVLLGIFYISLVALPFLLYIPDLLHASHILLIHPYIFVSHFYPFF